MTALRSLLFALYFGGVSATMTIGLSPLLFFGPRRAIVWAMRCWASLVLGGLKFITGIRMEVRGAEHIPQGGALIASKHLSMWETMVFHLLLADPAMVMKSELRKVPLYGRYAERAQMIIVDREAGAKALRLLLAEAKARLAEGRQIVIFPEGTRVNPGAPPDYKAGVAALYGHLGVPCTPVALNSGLYWPRRGLTRRPGTIRIEFLPPIAPGLSRPAFMAALEAAIESATARLLNSCKEPCG
jgi:1-acyl-sn-glycerol-3-phosphate acyltransferase